MLPVEEAHVKKKCFVCGAGPRGLRGYEYRNGKDVSWVCAEWLVPCHRRNTAFGRKVRKQIPVAERNRRTPQQRMHAERVAARRN